MSRRTPSWRDFIGDSNILDGVMLEDRVVKICEKGFPMYR